MSISILVQYIRLRAFKQVSNSRVLDAGITTQKRVTLSPYKPLTPASIAQHRYTFLVYRQPANYNPNLILASDFVGQPLSTFVASSGLQGPVGANFLREGLSVGK